MLSNKKRIRIDYAPLDIAVSVECVTPNSPLTQVWNAENGEWEPDREITPTVIRPVVEASAADGSWKDRYANRLLTDMKWYAGKTPIGSSPDWSGQTAAGEPLYEMDESGGNMRGSLTIRRNVSAEVCNLHFEGVITDPRLGMNIPVRTDDVILRATDKSEDAYSVSIGDSQVIQYNPFKDRLHLYNYKVAHGLITKSEAAQKAATDGNAYLRRIGVEVYRAGKKMTGGYTLELYRVNASVADKFEKLAALESGSPGTPNEVLEIGKDHITLDLRLVEKSDYLIRAVIDGSKAVSPQVQFSVNRTGQSYDCRPTNGTAINIGDRERRDAAMVDSEGTVVECPASIIRIVWRTDTAYLKGKRHNEGGTTAFLLTDTMIGSGYEDSWMDVYTESEIKPAHRFATEGSDYYTDGNGDRFIIN